MLTQQNLNCLVHLGVFRPQWFWKHRGEKIKKKKKEKNSTLRPEGYCEWDQDEKRVSLAFSCDDLEEASLIVLGENQEKNILLKRLIFITTC